MADLYDRLLADLQTLVVAMNLQGDGLNTGNIGHNVYVQTRSSKMRLLDVYPCVLITNEGQTEDELPATVTKDFPLSPVLIFISHQPIVTPTLAGPVYRQWRETVQVMIEG